MSRSLDFTACTRNDCIGCWRRLTKEEEQWLENNPNRQYYADFEDCPEFKKKEQKDVEMATKTEQSGCSKRL